jgi:hypothetical protein
MRRLLSLFSMGRGDVSTRTILFHTVIAKSPPSLFYIMSMRLRTSNLVVSTGSPPHQTTTLKQLLYI